MYTKIRLNLVVIAAENPCSFLLNNRRRLYSSFTRRKFCASSLFKFRKASRRCRSYLLAIYFEWFFLCPKKVFIFSREQAYGASVCSIWESEGEKLGREGWNWNSALEFSISVNDINRIVLYLFQNFYEFQIDCESVSCVNSVFFGTATIQLW